MSAHPLVQAGRAAVLAAATAAVLTAPAPASAQTPTPSPTPSPAPAKAVSAAQRLGHPADVTILDTKRIDLVSSVNGRRYSIDVALPDEPPPPGGYPVLYVLDGYGYFASVVEAARGNGNAPKTIVVGIGYPRDPAWSAAILDARRPLPPAFAGAPPFVAAASMERQRDMTLDVDAATLKQMAEIGMKAAPTDFGGVDGFLKTIEVDIKPKVYALADVNRADQSLFGHSLGGLAVLEALFTEPTAFRNFGVASPSIWWGQRAVLNKEAAFAAAVVSGKAAPRVLIEVGGEEETVPPIPPEMAARKAAIEASVKRSRMVGNACDLATRLKALNGPSGYEVTGCVTFPDQGHGISVWPAIGRMISFIAKP